MTLLKLALSLIVALLLLPLAVEGVRAAPGDVTLCSSDATGAEGNNFSLWPDVSSNGRYVAFISQATNLVPGATGMQAYRKDLLTGEVMLASADVVGNQGNNISTYTAISGDGRYVAFLSVSSNLVAPATTGQQVFRKDMLTGEVRLASSDAAWAQGNNASIEMDLSGDGRYVAFSSIATNLVAPATTGQQVFRKDMLTGEVRLASADATGAQGNNTSLWPCLNSDGRYVAFSSQATNLVAPITAGQQVFRKDMATGEVRLVSADPMGVPGDVASAYPSLNCDGRYVSFVSTSTNLVPTVLGQHIYRKDLASGAVLLVSANAAGNPGDNNSTFSSISADGRYVLFDSSSTNLITPATTNTQVFRKDLATAAVDLCSADAAGTQGNNTSIFPALTPDGRYAVFYSVSTNLVIPNTTNAQVFRKELAAPYCFYFAEGYTGANFQEYLCLGQPVAAPLAVKVTYLFKDGTTQEQTYNVPGNSRFTVNVNAVVGIDKEVSIKCEAAFPFIAERPMYFDYQEKWTGGHDVVGASAPSLTWYFAEGYTGAGFDEWICVLNPGDQPANLTFRFQTQEEGEKTVTGFAVGPHTRQTFKANDLLGGGSYQTSLALESDRCVVAERPMYFNYQGTNAWNWTGGHCVMGSSMLSCEYYFAEGTTRAGFEEWLTIQNPGATAINVQATYNLGSGAPEVRDYLIGSHSRTTLYVPSQIGTEKDVSVRLASFDYFLAERPMYFDYQGLASRGWTGGHCVIGANAPSTSWFLAEGYTGTGFEEWLCIQNPGTTDAGVAITYYPESGAPIVRTHNVAARSRFTVPVNVDAGSGLAISAEITSTQPVIVERPMYFSYGPGWAGGHDVVGYAP
jgi:Tol biopolymer transport system component